MFTKPLPHGWVLRQFAFADANPRQGAGVYRDEHELEHAGLKARLAVPDWCWAERDASDLVWAERGVLYRAAMTASGPAEARALFDFNGMKFEARRAPYD